jgi:hypothetical protein
MSTVLDPFLQRHVQEWIILSQRAALAGHFLVLGDGSEILDPEQGEEDRLESLGQSRISRARALATVLLS